jgi:biotin carboxyl carrier protein
MQFRFQNGERIYEIQVEKQGEIYMATVEGVQYVVDILDDALGRLSLRIQGEQVNVHWAQEGGKQWLSLDGCTFEVEKPRHKPVRRSETGRGELVTSPLPALVRAVNVVEGDIVEKGETLLLIEAMKMEIQVFAPLTGKIQRIFVSSGQTVQKDQNLVEIGA